MPFSESDRARRRDRSGPAAFPSASPSSAVKPIVLSTLRPSRERAHRGAAAEMGDDHPALRRCPARPAASAGDIFVGQAVKAVAAHAFGVELLRDRVVIGQIAHGRDERRCRSRRPAAAREIGQQRPDRRQIVRLMQRRERNEALQVASSTPCVDQDRPVVVRAAMHDAMPDRDRADAAVRRAASRRRPPIAAGTSATASIG